MSTPPCPTPRRARLGRWLGRQVAASSYHSGGVNVLMMDGTVKFIKNSINYMTWYALGTTDMGEAVNESSY